MIGDFINLIFPNCCFICDDWLARGEKYICTSCNYHLPRTNGHKHAENDYSNRLYGRGPFEHVLAYLKFIKKGKTQRLLYHLKYENQPAVGEMLGLWYGNDLKEGGLADAFDLIVPVPLHKSKLRKRGYNQSDSFAKGLSIALDVPWESKIISRTQKSETQTRKGRMERWQNVAHIFKLTDATAVAGKRILLVDDVLTTGATLEACAMPILAGECRQISAAVIAVAQ